VGKDGGLYDCSNCLIRMFMNVFYTDYYTQAAKENKFLFLLIWIKCILHFYQVSVALFSRIVKRECSNGISFINDTLR
jgi:hypothetical protein